MFSQHSKFLQGNSLISHIGPIPLSWSRVRRKLVRHDVEHHARYSVAKTQCIINIRYKLTRETRLRYGFNHK